MKKLYTTDQMIRALESRDSSVLVEIEKSYGALMRRLAFNLGLDANDTEECMNDAVLEVWNTIPPAKPASIRSYVCMLMRRTVVDRIRYNTAEKRKNTAYLEVVGELEDVLDVESAVIDKTCVSQALNRFLGKQTAQNREIFIRRFFEFESAKSIAADLLLSTNAVDTRLTRMRKELKQILNEWGYSNGT